MKVLFLLPGIPHYWADVLSKLNSVSGVKIICVVPTNVIEAIEFHIGEGLHLKTKKDAEYKIYKLEERRQFIKQKGYWFFKDLGKLILREKPDIIVTIDMYLEGFIYDLPTFLITKLLGVKLILKSIPFRLLRYHDKMEVVNEQFSKTPFEIRYLIKLMKAVKKTSVELPKVISNLVNSFVKLRRKIITRYLLEIDKIFFNLPHAHVNYIEEAVDIYGSYGVKKEKIFITYNSPNTDNLLLIRDSLR